MRASAAEGRKGLLLQCTLPAPEQLQGRMELHKLLPVRRPEIYPPVAAGNHRNLAAERMDGESGHALNGQKKEERA